VSVASEHSRSLAEMLTGGEGLPEADALSVEGLSGVFADLPLEADGSPGVELLRSALRAVIDPELGYSIVDLGLVRGVSKPQRGQVRVEMTLTSVGCPLADVLDAQVRMVLLALPGVDAVDLRLTFSPPWDTSMIASWAREELLAMGVRL
jgi:metal-sulfur cluster biosynthetic enzyme